ncbi:tetratricopeptide repeat protein [Rhodoligotrophos defluvii]|uniref:tetratricopeptide repeat protein n=1 Tax=Rhodoligotrophos defluvii TaxID=2561934 RepID=UPI001484D27A|nr:tetratricopeptide repeat protein [Rhodoligotrophos defluvii]
MSEESLYREVEEEVRKEQFKRLWNRFGAYVIGLCLLVIVGVGGYKLWQYFEHQQALNAGQQYVEAMELADQGKVDEAQAAFAKLAESSKTGPRTLAILQEAAIKLARNDVAGAVSAYDSIAADNDASPVLRDLARIRAAYLLVDTAPPAELEQRVGALNAEGNPWRNAAREIIALAAYRTGDLERANELLADIMGDPRASMSSRQRAQIVSALVSGALAAKNAPAARQQPAAGSAAPAASREQAPSTEAPAQSEASTAPTAGQGETTTSPAPAPAESSSSSSE